MAESVVLASKVYVAGDARERTLDGLRGLLADRLGDLEADASIDVREDDFPVVSLEGPDERAAANLLAEEFGEIPEALVPGETYVGTLEGWDDEGFVLDAGRDVRVPAAGLGLGQGTPTQIRDRFGLVQHTPMRFVYRGEPPEDGADEDGGDGDEVTDGDEAADSDDGDEAADGDDGEAANGGVDEAADSDNEGNDGDGGDLAGDEGADPADAGATHTELADAERDRLYDWRRGTGRVNVNSATRSEVRATINRAGHARDIVTVERLGLLEHSVVCAEGTDPPGLIASIGEYLPAELRAVV